MKKLSPKHFTKDTFKYFELARKNKNNQKWFDKNKPFYEAHIKAPAAYFLEQINKNMGQHLPQINVASTTLTRPLRPKNKIRDGGLIKTSTHFTVWEKRTSLFEWNPAIHFQIGEGKEDNFIGIGLYMVSSRQLSRLRTAVTDDFDEIDGLLNDKKLKNAWGGLLGEKYKRFPKGFDPALENTKYIWNKQFYLGKNLKRSAVLNKNFIDQTVKDLKLAMPFFQWVRRKVGTYKKSGFEY